MTRSDARFEKETRLRLEQIQVLRPQARNAAYFFALLLFCFSTCAEALAETDVPSLNLPSQIGERIAQCWKVPQTQAAQLIEITVRLRFSSAGVVIGEPRAVYVRAPRGAWLKGKNRSYVARSTS
jgi:hypothetical protein